MFLASPGDLCRSTRTCSLFTGTRGQSFQKPEVSLLWAWINYDLDTANCWRKVARVSWDYKLPTNHSFGLYQNQVQSSCLLWRHRCCFHHPRQAWFSSLTSLLLSLSLKQKYYWMPSSSFYSHPLTFSSLLPRYSVVIFSLELLESDAVCFSFSLAFDSKLGVLLVENSW